MNFWQRQQKPIIGLSPMDGITDYPFRTLVAKYSKPSVIFTEFVCVDHIFHAKNEVINEFVYDDEQRPIVAQIFGIDPELFYISAQVVCELGFDGIDINMGCPSKNVAQRGAGAGLIRNPKLASEIIESTKKGIDDWVKNGLNNEITERVSRKIIATKKVLQEFDIGLGSSNRSTIPISVKTRIGYATNEIETWIPFLLEKDLACISLHGRTYKQMYHEQADWQAIKRAGQIIKMADVANKPLLLGNGDITSREQALEFASIYEVDGVLIGRGFLGKPWLLNIENITEIPSIEQTFDIIREHSRLQEQFNPKKFFQVRKHLAWYCKGFKGAPRLRQNLVLCEDLKQVENLLEKFNKMA